MLQVASDGFWDLSCIFDASQLTDVAKLEYSADVVCFQYR